MDATQCGLGFWAMKNMCQVLDKMLAVTIILILLLCVLLIRFPSVGFLILFILALVCLLGRKSMFSSSSALHAAAEAEPPQYLYNDPPPCALNDGMEDAVYRKPLPASAVGTQVLADDPMPHPGQVDRMCEAQWFPRNQRRNLKEQQREDFGLHRSMRRDHEWGDTRTWSAEDKARYERARSRMETEIAGALKPDRYMIAEVDPERDYNFETDQPFPSVTSDSQVFHTAHFRIKSGNTGDFASLLRTVI